ncbi:NADPH-dependent oxidoreductase [Paracoccus aestuarii]|uniref:NADPH-dependent oxidoreductase n=1 Tax=Paracoccus aestuarii TaxID=453842 RepID=A0A418ZVJ6_9RHOB|nr:NAD(P)H-dependent oxidoreductase [Paracoccus aestuarii]RJL03947.1 NADPH-dependent oxidoreductase [Paracoccus aestuarii]WCQ98699.1 NAD(P)H-dependent oxidoreductase [Paracoccus aestuarii]
MSKPRIAVIIGSTRETRFADKPTDWFMDKVRDHVELEFEKLDLRDQDLPFFDEKASNLWVPSEDPRAVAWQEKLAGFDGFVFVVAEYNRSVTGALKNALDQAYKEWNRKPMTALAYGSVGGARALEQLRLIAIELQMVPCRNAVHIGGGDFFKVSPLGQDAPISEIEDNLKNALDGTL